MGLQWVFDSVREQYSGRLINRYLLNENGQLKGCLTYEHDEEVIWETKEIKD